MKSVTVSLRFDYGDDHAPGSFEWDVSPSCCDTLKRAFSENGIFVSNIAEETFNHVYINLVTTVACKHHFAGNGTGLSSSSTRSKLARFGLPESGASNRCLSLIHI